MLVKKRFLSETETIKYQNLGCEKKNEQEENGQHKFVQLGPYGLKCKKSNKCTIRVGRGMFVSFF